MTAKANIPLTDAAARLRMAIVRTGRRFIGIEKEPKYFDIARARIEAAIREKSEQLIPV